jgi:hypothetical protein
MIDPAESKTEIQVEQVEWVFGGPQSSSYEDANIVVIKASPSAFNHAPCLLSSIFLYVLLQLCIKSIGVVWHYSRIKIDLPIYPY